MLIPSCRHTPADLDYWAHLHAADILVGRRLVASGRVERAIEEMRRFAHDGPCYVATSWGKDSTVISHLAHLAGIRKPLVNIAMHGLGYDDSCPLVRDAFLASHPDMEYDEIVVDNDIAADDRTHAPGLDRGIAIAEKRYGTSRYIGGVRADESCVRRIRMRAYGVATANTCAPIGWWPVSDVWGYLAVMGLPVHPAYAMTGAGRYARDNIRVSTIGGKKGRQFSRHAWETEYYGDVLRRMEVTQWQSVAENR